MRQVLWPSQGDKRGPSQGRTSLCGWGRLQRRCAWPLGKSHFNKQGGKFSIAKKHKPVQLVAAWSPDMFKVQCCVRGRSLEAPGVGRMWEKSRPPPLSSYSQEGQWVSQHSFKMLSEILTCSCFLLTLLVKWSEILDWELMRKLWCHGKQSHLFVCN